MRIDTTGYDNLRYFAAAGVLARGIPASFTCCTKGFACTTEQIFLSSATHRALILNQLQLRNQNRI
jgi:hypothetical protein